MTGPSDVEAVVIARKLGAAQRRTVLSLTDDWGKAASHAAAKRLWYRNDIPLLLDHRHRTDNCWALRPARHRAVRRILERTTMKGDG
jgi:hypothetical protein